ncbi:OmpA family protein [Pseudozobellia sp. WGM2]|uniref:OmpA family protein n=1 Tax=Pseudozobellia sp. WGM2 TaxID=2787625 RepID=UPI001AE0385F|nr:OmpA family protein [Pseudozobellia sp. WGM2]
MLRTFLAVRVQLLILLLVSEIGYAQNLIKNPSFESFVNCPGHLGNFDSDVQNWSTPTGGSTDYFNGCSTEMGTPENFNGAQTADFGVGYAGLYLYAPDDYREYLQAELNGPLIKGEKYQISFYVSLAERSDFAIKEFGMLLAKEAINLTTKKVLSKKLLYQQKENDYSFMEIGYSNFYSDTQDWILVHTQFVAKGTERYLIMGNFKSNKRTRLFKTKRNAKQGAYYYVDMFKLTKVQPTNTTVKEVGLKTSLQIELDKTHVFENVLFKFDKFKITSKAETELKGVFEYLLQNEQARITINGHTDNIGSKDYNYRLSTQRARIVAEHLIKMGLDKGRVVYQGYGGEKPIASNKTEVGRQQNRRVEFIISKPSGLNTNL